MSRKTSKKSDSTFTRLLGWTVVLALVFSAGMITGQRLIRHDSMPPLVSLSVSKEAQAAANGQKADKRVPLKTTFSFYDHLSDAPSRDELVAKDEISAPAKAEKPAVAAAEKPAVAIEEKVEPEAVETDIIAEKAANDETAPEEVAEKVESQPEVAPAADEKEVAVEAPSDVEASAEAEEPASALIDKVTEALGADAAEPAKDSEVAGQFTIQVGNHVSKASAVRELARLRAMSFDAHMVAVEVSDKRFYRVRVGKYASDSDARAQLETLSAKDINGMVVPL